MDIRSSATKNPGSSGQPIKRTVGFAIAGDDDDGDEPVPFSLEGDGVELRAGGASTGRASVTDGDGVVGSPSPVLIMPTSLDAGGASASSSMNSPRGIPEIMQSVRNMKVQSAPQATPPKRAPPPKPRSPNKASSPSKTPPAPRPPPAAAAPKSAAREDEAAAKEAEKAAKAAEKAARKAAHLAASGGGGGGGGAGGAPSEKPKLSKAERRAQQEAQRAAKEAAKSVSAPAAAAPGGGGKKEKKEQGGGGGGGGGGEESATAAAAGSDSPAASSSKAIKAIKAERAASASSSKARPQSKLVDSFSHLRQYRAPPTKQHTSLAGATAAGVACHPAVARLAERYADGSIRGGRARCIALLHTLKIVIADFQTPSDAKYAHALTTCVNAVVQHIQSARAMAVSMGNAVKSLKTHLARMAEAPTPPSDEESRKKTLGHLEYFEREKLIQAGKFIAEHGAGEIADGDVIVTHGASHHVVEILLAAFDAGKTFRVVVVDSRPKLEGRETLKRLLGRGIPCAYTTLAGLGYVLRKGGATKTLVGAAAVLANGAVVSRVGTAVVAAASTHRGVPVLVAAETCKFHERVQVDAIASNELGNPAEIVDVGSGSGGSGGNGGGGGGGRGGGSPDSPLRGWEDAERLSVLNLLYDVTPAECVKNIVCESGLVAPADVPSFLR